MISLGQVFKAFKGIAGIRPEKITLQPFTYSKEIADEDEQNLLCVETRFPSKPDIPTSSTDNALASWRESCQSPGQLAHQGARKRPQYTFQDKNVR